MTLPSFAVPDAVAPDLFAEPERLHLLRQAATIVVLDDEQANVDLMASLLGRTGFLSVIGLTDATLLEDTGGASRPDLVVLDVHMPGRDGYAVLRALQPLAEREYLPVLVITGDGSAEARQEALQLGAKDFVTKPFDVIEVSLRVRNLIEMRLLFQDLRTSNHALRQSSSHRSRELESTRVEMVERLARAAEYRDDSTNRHNQRVGHLAAGVALAIGLTPEEAGLIRRAAALHDIGKIGIPDALLRKPSALTADEMRVMRTHTTIGARILGGSHLPLLQLAETIALSHHERWDGSGYPRGLRGEAIPLPGRIVAVVDAFDAMTSDRPYRAALSLSVALDRLHDACDSQLECRLAGALGDIVARPRGEPFESDVGDGNPALHGR